MKSGARSFSERAVQKSDERQAIAAVAAGRIPANSTLLLDASVTVLEFVRSLAADLEASFITTSPEVALAALDRQFSEVMLIGGRLNPQTRSALGPSAYSTVQSLSADFCILGACAVDADLVVRAENYDDAYLKLAMISACSEVILLTTSDKLLKQSAFAVGPISLITTLITDEAADEDILKRIRETGVEVVIARNAS